MNTPLPDVATRLTDAHRHETLFSARALHIKQSAVRNVFDISMRPGLISLAGGNPFLQTLPMDELGDIARDLIAEHGATALQYGSGQGTDELRRAICTVMAEEAITDAVPENVVVTTGAQSALDACTRVFCDPGDVVLTEDPTYVGALNTFEAYEVDVRPVDSDEHGLLPDALEAAIAAVTAEGKRVKFLYTIPSFANPSGAVLAADRRQRVVDVCRAANVLVVEDNPYGMLAFDGEPARPLRADNPDDVVYLGTFSKIFAPGLRLGWLLAPAHLKRRLYLANECVVLCPPAFNQMLAVEYLHRFDWVGQVRSYREVYRTRAEAMVAALESAMPDGVQWTTPTGGFFVWLTLPGHLDAETLLAPAIEAGVVFVPGSAFTAADGPSASLRLSFSAVEEDAIAEGVRRLAGVIRAAL
ncbi:GntR family transcriptional regulator [Tersicoccus solisilvae]|uniref:GntR family transcriptional regulator n=1 Tax=Tersicoccus solisilvae TaxID=1882339 RepID=A0ABQ1NLF3_9MICC|nr:PLP-dependent aminotransferase family protein [Tersicoccus solisilvae]GGC80084.1 GntR family transcriptional regulator [Tersicoccus solisilvae]